MEFESYGVDPLFPGSGEVYKANGFYLNDVHGGKATRDWIDKNFKARDDDVYVVTFPKTGTTWAQELVYVIGTDFNFEKAKSKRMMERFPYLELKHITESNMVGKLETPRFIKSHYPYSLLPESMLDKKIVYTIRNPKDTLVSYYHFAKNSKSFQYTGDFETYFKLFIQEERICYAPYSKHILEFWERRHQDNILILHYEDMKKDFPAAVRTVAKFLGKSYTEDQVQQVAAHCSFDSMSKNPNTNLIGVVPDFMRKGEVGDWKNHFTEEMNNQMNDYIDRHFAGTGLNFRYE